MYTTLFNCTFCIKISYLSQIENQEEFPSLHNCDSLEHFKLDRSRLRYFELDQPCGQVGHSLKSL